MRRLLLLASEFPPGPGGIGTHAYHFALHMAQSGWQVRALTFQDYALEADIERFNGAQPFEIERLSRPKNRLVDIASRWQRLRKTLRSWEPDVLVVTGDRQVWLVACVLSSTRWKPMNRFNLPWCAVWHGSTPQYILEKYFTRWAFQQPDLTISVSDYSMGQLQKLSARPRQGLVIPNGGNESQFYPDREAGMRLRCELGLENALLLLTVGHVAERKGQDIVIQALPDILKRLPNVHYLVAGLPTRQASLEKLALELGVRQHVHFLGRMEPDGLFAAYNACDVFVLTSRHSGDGQYEGYGIVVVEAALCGKPAVVAENSGLVEAIQEGRTGLVVPENDPPSTAAALEKLLADPSLRQQMGQQARRRAAAEQTWNACMDRYRQALSQLAQGGS